MPLAQNSKLARIRHAMAAADWQRAIRLAARFPVLGEHGVDIRRANDAINNPRIYRQLGHDLQEIQQRGIAALKARFSKSWKSVGQSANKASEANSEKGGQ